ncbi:MAG: FHA domain-containing protein [Planctomycetota bacterium]
MQPFLIAIKQDGTSKRIPFSGDDITVGRDHGCKLRLPLASVSRRHCEFVADNGRVLVRDLGSSNGTFVNRRQVQESDLSDGDLVAVGPVVFLVSLKGDPDVEDPSSTYARGRPESRGKTADHAPLAPPASGVLDSDDPFAAAAGDDGPKPASSDDSSFADFDFDFSDEEDLPSL